VDARERRKVARREVITNHLAPVNDRGQSEMSLIVGRDHSGSGG
jgi:hypothetical protein